MGVAMRRPKSSASEAAFGRSSHPSFDMGGKKCITIKGLR